jgi:hypothetical protein
MKRKFFLPFHEREIYQNFHQPFVPQFVWESSVFFRCYRFFHIKFLKRSSTSPIIYSPPFHYSIFINKNLNLKIELFKKKKINERRLTVSIINLLLREIEIKHNYTTDV